MNECKFAIVELEQHIYGMVDVGRGVTKDRRTIYNISRSRSSYPFMWGSLRLAPIIVVRACVRTSGKVTGSDSTQAKTFYFLGITGLGAIQ